MPTLEPRDRRRVTPYADLAHTDSPEHEWFVLCADEECGFAVPTECPFDPYAVVKVHYCVSHIAIDHTR
ncbi:hypothetical protein [Actinokineospora sp. NBRC 105648]|uniref:hypothetical protein n=1 Tax=Actinokineospora sp. NBRC 105648 TaxID=3032206 RepID=UPI0024A5E0C2|nr:hypothetical protein [Actinokineospora sp. NBRC 105648]GLZ42809.1 hypothetical protein Acsp05_64330 [Actinokineospora sp. NBRC 105648]